MASNVYTKNEILQDLASRGFFVDSYTLDTFFQKWKVEAIFEDEQGTEFFDKNALDLVLNNLFNTSGEDTKEDKKEELEAKILSYPEQNNNQTLLPQNQNVPYNQMDNNFNPILQEQYQNPNPNLNLNINPNSNINNVQNQNFNIADKETTDILNNIALSDGTPLMNKIQGTNDKQFQAFENTITQAPMNIEMPTIPLPNESIKKEKKIGILEGAMQATGQEFTPVEPEEKENNSTSNNDDNPDFDDISLLSESLEAQEKFREYVVSELSKKNVDLTPKQNEFKLDISERTLNMIARSMAKKIAKHVSQICSNDAKSSFQLTEVQEENKKLEQKTKDLEDQNRKLRLLLAESNKNLNSYKPSIFGFYRKVTPKN